MRKIYMKLPNRVRICIAWVFSVLIACPVYVVDGMARGAREGWCDYRCLHREGMGNLRAEKMGGDK